MVNFKTSLEVQWLRLCTAIAGGTVSIPGRGTEILHVACMAKKKKKSLKYLLLPVY